MNTVAQAIKDDRQPWLAVALLIVVLLCLALCGCGGAHGVLPWYSEAPPMPPTSGELEVQSAELNTPRPVMKAAMVNPNTVSVPIWWDLPADTNVAYVTAYVDTTPGQGVFSASQQNLPLGTNAVLQLPADRPSYVMVATRTAGGGEAPGNEALFVPSGCPLYAAQSNGLMTVVWYGVQGTVYTLQGQAELGTHWAEVAASIPGTNGPNVWSEVPLTPEGYFRLKLN